jgi:hypothetical protein
MSVIALIVVKHKLIADLLADLQNLLHDNLLVVGLPMHKDRLDDIASIFMLRKFEQGIIPCQHLEDGSFMIFASAYEHLLDNVIAWRKNEREREEFKDQSCEKPTTTITAQ